MQYIDNENIIFIINPNSGSTNPKKIINKIIKTDSRISYVITHNTKELEYFFKYNFDKFKVFVAVGGDGTVHEIMKYLINNKEKVLAVLPTGSGNGFALELNFKNNVKLLLDDILKGEIISIDVLEINSNKCINVAGLGIDGCVAHGFKTSGRGLRNYIFLTFKAICHFKSFEATITTPNKIIKGNFIMITIANTRQYGNYAIISPNSKPDDGQYEIVLIKPFPIYYYPIFISKLFLGRLNNSSYISYLTAKDNITITSPYKEYHIDGEPLYNHENLNIKLLRNCLQVVKTSH